MANEEQLALLRQGVDAWNEWRGVNAWNEWRPQDYSSEPDLSRADLHGADLSGANLSGTILTRADLHGANLRGATLTGADLIRADLREADLRGAVLVGANSLGAADLREANLQGANLRGADLRGVNLSGAKLTEVNLHEAVLSTAVLSGANLRGANFSGAVLDRTVLGYIDLSGTRGLEACNHFGPSLIDYGTLERSWPLPLEFLRGVGLPDNLIDNLPSLLNQPIQLYSCFISYSSKDDDFARRLHADLQAKDVRCWFAPEDMKTGDRIRDTIDQAIRLRDKLLVVLSENSIGSPWVEDEVETALEEERHSPERRTVLFPVRIDDAVLQTDRAWARKLRRERHIGEFTRWKDHDTYQKGFERLLRDLKPELARRPGRET